jgi:hypothetical protein
VKTIEELKEHLQGYREKKVDFPTYKELVELTEQDSNRTKFEELE